MEPLWIIQKNLNDDDKKLLPVMDELNIKYQLIEIIPFSDNIPEINYEGPIIVRGSTTTLKGAEKTSWKPGVWHNENFSPEGYKKIFEHNYINAQGSIHILKDLTPKDLDNIYGKQQHMFVRPNSDYKEFTGIPMSKRDLKKLTKSMQLGNSLIPENLKVLIAPAISIYYEARMIVVDKQIVSGYSYKVRGGRKYSPATLESKTFAQVLPLDLAEVFCLDIGFTCEGYKVIECNCFNASGIYGDHETIVKKVTDFVRRKY
jgi:hypothetical protein